MIEKRDSNHFHCNSCIKGDNDVKDFRIGHKNMATVLSLCSDCRKLLRELLQEDIIVLKPVIRSIKIADVEAEVIKGDT